MKIVIDVPDDVYRVLKEDIYPIPDTERLTSVFKTLVKKGTPLPKGYGRLIDADSMKRIDAIQRGDFNSIKSIRAWIDIMPTVIEADKEGENESNESDN